VKLVHRDLKPSDRPFIAATWSQAWPRPMEAGVVTSAAWKSAVFASVGELLDRPDVHVRVVADADADAGDADVFGYLVWQEVAGEALPVLLFCFVKADARRTGLARALLRAARIDPALPLPCACWTRSVTELRAAGKLPAAQWRPDLGRLRHPAPRTPDR
jgi:GNAT superfamily N-acetyltransferase